MLVHTGKPSNMEMEAGGSEVQGYPWLPKKLARPTWDKIVTIKSKILRRNN